MHPNSEGAIVHGAAHLGKFINEVLKLAESYQKGQSWSNRSGDVIIGQTLKSVLSQIILANMITEEISLCYPEFSFHCKSVHLAIGLFTTRALEPIRQ